MTRRSRTTDTGFKEVSASSASAWGHAPLLVLGLGGRGAEGPHLLQRFFNSLAIALQSEGFQLIHALKKGGGIVS